MTNLRQGLLVAIVAAAGLTALMQAIAELGHPTAAQRAWVYAFLWIGVVIAFAAAVVVWALQDAPTSGAAGGTASLSRPATLSEDQPRPPRSSGPIVKFVLFVGTAILGALIGATLLSSMILAFRDPAAPDHFWWIVQAFSAVAWTCIASAGLLLVAYLFYRFVRWILHLIYLGLNFHGIHPIAILISLALAASIFRTGAQNVWFVGYSLASAILTDLPRVVIDIGAGSYACLHGHATNASSPASDCIVASGVRVSSGLKQLLDDGLRYFANSISILQFVAGWAVIAWILGDLTGRADLPDAPMGVRRIIAGFSPGARKRIGLSAVIALAAYLCLCAVVAVSVFKPAAQPQELSEKDFKERIEKAKLPSEGPGSSFASRFPITLGEDLSTNSGQSADNPLRQYLLNEYADLSSTWPNLRLQVIAAQDQLAQTAEDRYRLENLNRVGTHERATHYLALESWYYNGLANMLGNLDRCRNAILALRSAVKAPAPAPVALVTKILGTLGTSFDPGYLSAGAARRSCSTVTTSNIDEPPSRGEFGYTLGILGTLSIWLLSTESMPLALITGLVGFGLFGALVSTFVRAPGASVEQVDVFGVLWRGLSAAIVVFLAAYGGIAIVSQTTGDPNPYVVFVTCLVGAVFGDVVWRRARRTILAPDDPHKAREADNARNSTGRHK